MKMPRQSNSLAVCLKNDGYKASLERRKIYVVLPDDAAAKHGLLRVIDDSGYDYLYPRNYFAEIDAPPSVNCARLISKYQDRRQLRSLLLDGAASPPGVAADDVYFDTLRDRVRSRTWG